MVCVEYLDKWIEQCKLHTTTRQGPVYREVWMGMSERVFPQK